MDMLHWHAVNKWENFIFAIKEALYFCSTTKWIYSLKIKYHPKDDRQKKHAIFQWQCQNIKQFTQSKLQSVTYVIYSNSHGINMRIFTIKLRELASTWLEPETCQALGYQVWYIWTFDICSTSIGFALPSTPMCWTHSCSLDSLQLDRQNSIPNSVFSLKHVRMPRKVYALHKILTSLVSEPQVMYPSWTDSPTKFCTSNY